MSTAKEWTQHEWVVYGEDGYEIASCNSSDIAAQIVREHNAAIRAAIPSAEQAEFPVDRTDE